MATKDSNLTLLIDGDNVSPSIIVGLMAEIAKYGNAGVRRMYGDWTNPCLKGWKACLLEYLIIPIQQFAYTSGKNSTDGAMIIDAMDLLYTGRFSGFCIVSSDSDFTRLAARIRKQGVTVYGFGERKTNTAFIAACQRFVCLKVLDEGPEELSIAPQSLRAGGNAQGLVDASPTAPQPLDYTVLEELRKAVLCVGNDSGDWVNLADVGQYLRKIEPTFHQRNYGYERFRDFANASGLVEFGRNRTGQDPLVVFVRLKKIWHTNLA